MKLFIDSANIEEIREAMSWGVIDGVTTNPSLIRKEVERLSAKATASPVAMSSQTLEHHLVDILLAADEGHPVSLEVTGLTADEMIFQARRIHKRFGHYAHNVIIKIPVNPDAGLGNASDGLIAIRALSEEGMRINATLIFTPEQAVMAAKAGATYVSPFVGRVDDCLRAKAKLPAQKEAYFPMEGMTDSSGNAIEDDGIVSGIDLLEQIVDIFRKHDIQTHILAASLRTPRQVREAMLVGADIATVPYAVLKAMLSHHKTREGVQKFMEDTVEDYADLCR